MKRIYELKVSLENTPVWRLLLVPDILSFYELHHAIQIAFGWKNYHLYAFTANGQTIANPELIEDSKAINDRTIFINQVLQKKNGTIQYEYDFGDSWLHTITLKKISPSETELKIAICLDGAMACPPEDCGGIPGYLNLLEAMKSSKHPEYEEYVHWLGKAFDPEEFNLQKINRELKSFKKYIKEYESAY